MRNPINDATAGKWETDTLVTSLAASVFHSLRFQNRFSDNRPPGPVLTVPLHACKELQTRCDSAHRVHTHIATPPPAAIPDMRRIFCHWKRFTFPVYIYEYLTYCLSPRSPIYVSLVQPNFLLRVWYFCTFTLGNAEFLRVSSIYNLNHSIPWIQKSERDWQNKIINRICLIKIIIGLKYISLFWLSYKRNWIYVCCSAQFNKFI